MALSLLRSLFAHAEWANARVLESLRSAPDLDPEALKRYAHVLAAEHVWLSRIQGHEARVPVWPELSLAECEALSAENVQGYARLLTDEHEDSLQRDVPYANTAGDRFTTPVVDILSHVAMHGAYHRGQVALLLRRGGGTPAPTDYIVFVRGNSPRDVPPDAIR